MDGAGQQFFAGAGFALDEDGRVSGRDGFNLLKDLAHSGAFAHDDVESALEIDFVFEVLLLLAEALARLGKSGLRVLWRGIRRVHEGWRW